MTIPSLQEIVDLYDVYQIARQSRPKGKTNSLLGKKGKSAELLKWEEETLTPIHEKILKLFDRMGTQPSPSTEHFSHLYQLARALHQKGEPFEGGYFLKDGDVHQIVEVLETRDCETCLQIVCHTDRSDVEYIETGFIFSTAEGIEFHAPHWFAYINKTIA